MTTDLHPNGPGVAPSDETGTYPALAGVTFASTGDRMLAFVVNNVLGLIMFFLPLLFLWRVAQGADPGGAVMVWLVLELAFLGLALYALFGKASNIGGWLIGLTHVDVTTGRKAPGKTFVKFFVQSLVVSFTFGLGWLIAVITLKPPMNRNWFDRMAGVVVVKGYDKRAPLGLRPVGALSKPSFGPPRPMIQAVPPMTSAATPPTPPPAGVGPVATMAPPPVASAPVSSIPPPSAPPSPVGAPPAGLAPDVPATFGDVLFAPAPVGSAPVGTDPVWPITPPPIAPPPGSGSGGQTWSGAPAPQIRDMRPPEPQVDPAHDNGSPRVDRTVQRTFASPRILLDNGEEISLDVPVLIGRNPSHPAQFAMARLVAVPDSERSISKTHLVVGAEGTGVWVLDLQSTNGVKVSGPAGLVKIAPGERHTVAAGGRVEYGDRSFQVRAP